MGVRWYTDEGRGSYSQRECDRKNRLEREKDREMYTKKEEVFEVGPLVAYMLEHDFAADLMASDGSIESP
jgi:hypothetical protein